MMNRSVCFCVWTWRTQWFTSAVGHDYQSRKARCGTIYWGEYAESITRMLSSGQARKLMIARLLVERPNLLLLDEPTNHVSFSVSRRSLDIAGRRSDAAADNGCDAGGRRAHARRDR